MLHLHYQQNETELMRYAKYHKIRLLHTNVLEQLLPVFTMSMPKNLHVALFNSGIECQILGVALQEEVGNSWIN